MVLDLYQPQRLKGKAFKLAATLLSLTKHAHGAYSHQPAADILPSIPWLQQAARANSLGFMGCNPSHGLRCIIAGIDPETGGTFVAKLGFGKSADAIRGEHTALRMLDGQFPGVIKPSESETADDWYLMRLPYLGNNSPSSMSHPAIHQLLTSWLCEETVRIDECKLVAGMIARTQVDLKLSGWHLMTGALKISKALVHGDFAVWNLRNTPEGLFAIDWEWAEPEGLAGIDLVHGLRQEAVMVRKLHPKAAIAWMSEQLQSSTWLPYLTQSGWKNHVHDLLRIGLLNSHFNAHNDSRDLLAELGVHV
jgi:hypothetical protein